MGGSSGRVCYAGGEWQDLLFRVQSIIPIDFDEVTHDQHSLLGFPRQARLEANETLPAKLDLIIDRLALRDRVWDEIVAIKMHTGNNLSYSTAHPVFIRKVVQAVKDGGGKPFVVDLDWDVREAERRGYSTEVLGCPVYPLSGLKDGYHYTHEFLLKHA